MKLTIRALAIAALVLATVPFSASAHARHYHHRHHAGVNWKLVAHINARLDRFVHRSHQCGLESEWLTTQYGRESGPRTATGERFVPSRFTAAHMHLPFGTRLRVTNPGTGRSVTVKINDRGPATRAKLDISTGAARAIGMRSSAYLCVTEL